MDKLANRILIVDDSEAIHRDIIKILSGPKRAHQRADLSEIERELFDSSATPKATDHPSVIEAIRYRIDSAFQGSEAVEMVDRAAEEGYPYAMVFMDVRMPPGMNGIETIEQIWRSHPAIEMVIVTAFSDHSWEDILMRVGRTDKLMILRKPFDLITIKQLALALTQKYQISVKVQSYLKHIELEVQNGSPQLHGMVQELRRLLH